VRFWVTGSGGYIGSRLLNSLRRRFPRAVVQGDRRGPGPAPRFKSIDDVGARLARFRPTHVVHCLGRTRPGTLQQLNAAHVAPTFFLLEALRRLPVPRPRVLLVGSAAEYGASRRRLTESAPARPQTDYGVSKLLQTRLGLAFHALGVPVIVARLFNLYAPDAPATFAVPRVWNLLRRKSKGRKILETGPQNAVRDFLALPDALEALALLATRGTPGEIYNVCSGRGLRVGELFDAMAEGAGVSVGWKTTGTGSGKSAASVAVGDPAKIRRRTGWRPRVDVLALARAGKKS
jgi:GDP-4-dehydro-6-deoxy-D-mannose reductase